MTIGYGIATEAAPVIQLDGTDASTGIVDCIIVQEGWGQSGYYPREVLERDHAVFTEGLHSFLDHPELGKAERGSTVVGTQATASRFVASDPQAGGKPTVRAGFKFFKTGMYNDAWIRERAEHKTLALSLRAPVSHQIGVREGRTGRVVTKLHPALSVDVVARPGAGGSFGTFQESAIPGATDTKEGEETVALDKSDLDALGTAFAAAVAPLQTAIAGLAQENKVVAPAITFSELRTKLAKSELSDKAQDRITVAVESKGADATTAFVDEEIAREKAIATEARESAIAGVKEGTIALEGYVPTGKSGEEGKGGEGNLDAMPRTWASKKEA